MTYIFFAGIVTLNKLPIWQLIELFAYVLERSTKDNFRHVRFILKERTEIVTLHIEFSSSLLNVYIMENMIENKQRMTTVFVAWCRLFLSTGHWEIMIIIPFFHS